MTNKNDGRKYFYFKDERGRFLRATWNPATNKVYLMALNKAREWVVLPKSRKPRNLVGIQTSDVESLRN